MMKLEKGKIYLPLQGRIGNQLFQYSLARKIQLSMPEDTIIVMDDSDILRCGWVNSLMCYNLPNVEFIHDSIIHNFNVFSKQYYLRKMYRVATRKKDYIEKYRIEKNMNNFLNKNGMFICENGYIKPDLNLSNPIYLEGYFQSQLYFDDIKEDLLCLFNLENNDKFIRYPNLKSLKARNSVCVSIKVEHNVGSSMYDVCSMGYWEKAINYITENVEDPLFFICSDNVNYVTSHLIDTTKYEVVEQAADMPVHVSLSAMAECKHFVIGNTTFGWWAQYLAKNRNKIVVAPSKWMAVEMPIHIYDDNWHIINV